jgi:hypothetical protein
MSSRLLVDYERDDDPRRLSVAEAIEWSSDLFNEDPLTGFVDWSRAWDLSSASSIKDIREAVAHQAGHTFGDCDCNYLLNHPHIVPSLLGLNIHEHDEPMYIPSYTQWFDFREWEVDMVALNQLNPLHIAYRIKNNPSDTRPVVIVAPPCAGKSFVTSRLKLAFPELCVWDTDNCHEWNADPNDPDPHHDDPFRDMFNLSVNQVNEPSPPPSSLYQRPTRTAYGSQLLGKRAIEHFHDVLIVCQSDHEDTGLVNGLEAPHHITHGRIPDIIVTNLFGRYAFEMGEAGCDVFFMCPTYEAFFRNLETKSLKHRSRKEYLRWFNEYRWLCSIPGLLDNSATSHFQNCGINFISESWKELFLHIKKRAQYMEDYQRLRPNGHKYGRNLLKIFQRLMYWRKFSPVLDEFD